MARRELKRRQAEVPVKGTLVLAVAHWFTDRQKLIDDIAREIDTFIGERRTGCFVVKVEEPPQLSRCSACERDKRREWTEPEEHTCAKNNALRIDSPATLS